MNRIGPADDPDRYELEELKGSGGEGQLWRGSIAVDGASIPVAIKIVHPNKMADIDEWRQRWQRQAELLRSLDHPGLVKVREVFEGPNPHEAGAADLGSGTLCLVMNWVEGPSLDEWVERHPDRDVLDCSKVLGKLAGAVDYLHSGSVTGVPVLHRDIKPSNVIVSAAGPVLVDFGFTRVLGGQPMTWAGTANYVAPEVIQKGEFSPATDRFAVGATAYFALTGETPNIDDRQGMASRLTAVAGAQGRDDIADHVLAMMDNEPSRRPTALIPWAQQLAAAAVSDTSLAVGATQPMPFGTSAPTTDTIQPTEEPRRGRGGLIVAIFVLLVVLGGGLAFAATRSGDDSDDATASVEPAATTETAVGGEAVKTAEVAPTAAPTTQATTTTEATTTTVPLSVISDVSGLEPSAAVSALEAVGLTAVVIDEEGTVPFDVVTAIAPEPGEEVEPGTEVVLTVSRAPAVLPDVVGQTRDDAVEMLESIGVAVTVSDLLEEGVRNDAVLSQQPEGGSEYAAAVALSVGVQPDIVYLADIEPVEASESVSTRQVDVDGEVYTRSVSFAGSSSGSYVEYNLSRDFLRVVGSVGVPDDQLSDTLLQVEIYADGVPIFDETVVLGQAIPVDLDVTGVLRLRLQVTDLDGNSRRGYAAFADARLIGPPGAAEGISED